MARCSASPFRSDCGCPVRKGSPAAHRARIRLPFAGSTESNDETDPHAAREPSRTGLALARCRDAHPPERRLAASPRAAAAGPPAAVPFAAARGPGARRRPTEPDYARTVAAAPRGRREAEDTPARRNRPPGGLLAVAWPRPTAWLTHPLFCSGQSALTPARTTITATAPTTSGVTLKIACGPMDSGKITEAVVAATFPKSPETDFNAGQSRSITDG